MAAPKHYTPQPSVPPKSRRIFTVHEANRALPLVRRIVRDIVQTHQRAADTQEKLESAANIKDAMVVQNDLEATVDRLQEYVDELAGVGCDLKDYEMGLIDFPGRHCGREVCLCWKLGEEKIEYWHETESGYAGRQRIDTLEETE